MTPVPVAVRYLTFDGTEAVGTLEVHPHLVGPVRAVFDALLDRGFPLARVATYAQAKQLPQAEQWRTTLGWRPSKAVGSDRPSHHSAGLALDLNPHLNPYQSGGTTLPPGAVYDPTLPGTVTPDVVALFKAHGFLWGGDWHTKKDYMHFSWADSVALVGLPPETPGPLRLGPA